MPRSTATNTGIGAIALGVAGCGFAAFGLAITLLQRLIFLVGQQGASGRERAFFEALGALHVAWWVHMPLWIVGGAWLAFWGNRLRKGRQEAARVLRITCWVALAAMVAYVIDCGFVMRTWQRTVYEAMPTGLFLVFALFVCAGAVPVFVPFALLLRGLSRIGDARTA